MSEPEAPPAISITLEPLQKSGFTAAGQKRFVDTVQDYGAQLFGRSVKYAEANKAPDVDRDVTYEHVRTAAHSLAGSFGRPEPPKWILPCQIGEYIATGVAGAGVGHLDKTWGIALALAGTAGAILLLILRVTKGKVE